MIENNALVFFKKTQGSNGRAVILFIGKSMSNLSLLEVKALAKEFHGSMKQLGNQSKLSEWQEHIAKAFKYRDWNTYHAQAKDVPEFDDKGNCRVKVAFSFVFDRSNNPSFHITFSQEHSATFSDLIPPLAQSIKNANHHFEHITHISKPDRLDGKQPEFSMFDVFTWDKNDDYKIDYSITDLGEFTPLVLNDISGAIVYLWLLDIHTVASGKLGRPHVKWVSFYDGSEQGKPVVDQLVEKIAQATPKQRECYFIDPYGTYVSDYSDIYFDGTTVLICREGDAKPVEILYRCSWGQEERSAQEHVDAENKKLGISKADALMISRQFYLGLEEPPMDDYGHG